MTRHLSDAVLLEMVEAGKSHPHISECDRCRRASEDAREALMLARAEQVPEPSPLFWERFSARVHEATQAEPDLRRRPAFGWLAAPGWRSVTAIVLAALVVAAAAWQFRHAGEATPQLATSTRTTAAPPARSEVASADAQTVADLLAPATDPSWLVIAQVTANMRTANAAEAGLVLQPDASERAIAELSPVEQQELVRLLRSDQEGPSQ